MVIKKNIPQLRFPEFEGEYEKRILNDTCTIVGGGTPDSGKEELWNGHIQWFTPTEIKMDYVSKSERTITELGLKKSSARILPKGTILLTSRATIGEVAIALNECTTNQGFQSLIVNKLYNNLFIFNWIKNNRYQFVRRANGSTFLEISKSEIGKIPICTPTLPEQQKIASFFTAIDQKITQLKRKLTLLEQYKKGVMQLIFSQEIRFKDDKGQEFPKWKEKKLEDLGSIRMCKRIFANQTQKTGEVPFFKIGTIGNIADAYISIDLFNEYKSRYNYPIKGQTLITCSGTIGKCVQFDGRDSYYQDSNIVWIDNTDKEVLDDFLYILLSNYKWGKLNSTTITRIYTNDLKALKFKFPTKTEQIKIANFLSAIDDKINHTQTQIEKAEVWKKGLMQQMFV